MLLTGRYAYKIKKPLDLSFVDYATLERREHFCLEELRLNRRLAPSLYLAVLPLPAALIERKVRGYIRECHGDLHLNNIVQLNGEPTIFDGVEFNDALRWIDVMSELAFLIMDLDDRGAPGMANRALNAYLHKSGDYGGILLLRFYQVYRAMVRAKIACIRVEQNDKQHAILDQYRSYASLAEHYTQAPKPYLLISHGVTGSGKSAISRQLADVLGAIWLRSDVERGRDGYGVNRRRYSVSARGAVYDRLLQLSRAIIDSGFGVIVDATFLQAAQVQDSARLRARNDCRF